MKKEDNDIMDEILEQLLALEENRFLAGFHQQVEKSREKAWHNQHIKQQNSKNGDFVLLYDSKFLQFPSKFKMHWLGLYVIKDISDCGVIHVVKLNGELFVGRVNGSRLKIHRDDFVPRAAQ